MSKHFLMHLNLGERVDAYALFNGNGNIGPAMRDSYHGHITDIRPTLLVESLQVSDAPCLQKKAVWIAK